MTVWGALRLPTAVPSPAAFAASSPLIGRGGMPALARLWIPAYAGMTVMGAGMTAARKA